MRNENPDQLEYSYNLRMAEEHDPKNLYVKGVRDFHAKRGFISRAQNNVLLKILARPKPTNVSDNSFLGYSGTTEEIAKLKKLKAWFDNLLGKIS